MSTRSDTGSDNPLKFPAHADEKEFAEESDSLWHLVVSPVIWVFHFLFCYILTAIVCSRQDALVEITQLRFYILFVTLASLGGICYTGWRSWHQWGFADDRVHVQDQPTPEHRHEFLGHASWLLSIVSFIAVCYVAMPVLFLNTCQ